ncbi:biotin-dependent carboxyltransferase family protein [Nocardioides sp. B-3]|uniref:5-oxoprolinase subunit C family protein n=1 Tax=Nocardioides sp. B-3 TaxID=2895565 RepID=UPI002152E1E0|nr:biotin-dependent carboxyltransferase family protein [Nocardioides sp. B-3]UUZ58550.1 biotin-dependent carboxyltransferase family protein [Nocardioides sp. B-3]
MNSIEVLDAGPLTTVQDFGRPGLAALGVGRSGAADADAMRLANRLVGNAESAATLEVTFGGLRVRAHGGARVALTGAPCPMSVGGREVAPYSVFWMPDGDVLRLGLPSSGLRSYLAVRGGIEVPRVIGSRSTDTLSAVGPAPLSPGDRPDIGHEPPQPLTVDLAPVRQPEAGDLRLRVVLGPRDDWFTDDARRSLLREPYEVTAESNRIGMRLGGTPLARSRTEELPSEGMVCGALQVPPSGQPTLFLADHPVTGGYPVIAVVIGADIGLAARARPGQQLWFSAVKGPDPGFQ